MKRSLHAGTVACTLLGEGYLVNTIALMKVLLSLS
jgi:hypothetical protein